jgi:integrase
MRRVQVAGLKIGYIVIGRLIIRVIEDKDRKEGKHRDLPLSPVLLEILRAYWH